jgi:hypothetical protein
MTVKQNSKSRSKQQLTVPRNKLNLKRSKKTRKQNVSSNSKLKFGHVKKGRRSAKSLKENRLKSKLRRKRPRENLWISSKLKMKNERLGRGKKRRAK